MSDEKPAEKETVRFEAPPKWAQDGFGRIHESIGAVEARINTRMDEQDSKLDKCVTGMQTLTNEVERHNGELRGLHEWKGGIEERLNNNSMRAKQGSKHDDDQDMKLQELENRITAATESSMRVLIAEAKQAAKTPTGQRVVQVLVGLLIALATFASGWLTHGGAK